MASSHPERRRSANRTTRRQARRNSNDDGVIMLGSPDCIDLTTERNNDDVIDITLNAGLMDLPVVVLTPTDYQGPIRNRRGSGRLGRRRSSVVRREGRRHRMQEAHPPEAQSSAFVNLSDESDTDLPDLTEAGASANNSALQSPENVKIVCPVCMDDTRQIRRNHKELRSTTCGHIFCNVCIETAIRLQRQCPTCRKKLAMRSIHPLFI